jgi:hypothetical protein
LCDGFVNLRFGATGSNTTDCLAVHLDGQSALVVEKVRKSEDLEMALFQYLGAGFLRTLVERSVAGFLLGEFDGVERGGIRFLQKKNLSSTMQIVSSTFSFLASASAAATIILIAAKFTNFLVGGSAECAAAKKLSMA